MLAGSYGLSEFTDIRVKKREERVRQLTVEESELFNKKKNKKVESIEDLYDVSRLIYFLGIAEIAETFCRRKIQYCRNS